MMPSYFLLKNLQDFRSLKPSEITDICTKADNQYLFGNYRSPSLFMAAYIYAYYPKLNLSQNRLGRVFNAKASDICRVAQTMGVEDGGINEIQASDKEIKGKPEGIR